MEQDSKRSAFSQNADTPVRYNREQAKYSMLAYFRRLKQIEQELEQKTLNSEIVDSTLLIADDFQAVPRTRTRSVHFFRKKVLQQEISRDEHMDRLHERSQACSDLFAQLPQFKRQPTDIQHQNQQQETQNQSQQVIAIGGLQNNSQLIRCNLSAANLSFLKYRHNISNSSASESILRSNVVVPHRALIQIPQPEQKPEETTHDRDFPWFWNKLDKESGATLVGNDNVSCKLLRLGQPVDELIDGTIYFSASTAMDGQFSVQKLADFIQSCYLYSSGYNMISCSSLCYLQPASLHLSITDLYSLVLCDISGDGDGEDCLDIAIDSLSQLIVQNCTFRYICVRSVCLRALHISYTKDDAPQEMRLYSAKSATSALSERFGAGMRWLERVSLENCDLSSFDLTDSVTLGEISIRRSRRVPQLSTMHLPLNLRVLDCQFACMRLQPRISACDALTKLILSDTRIRRLDCSNLPQCLTELLVARCGLRSFADAELLTALSTLDLQNNEIRDLPRLPDSLKTLNVSQNPLNGLNGAEYATQLEILDVSSLSAADADFWFVSARLRRLVAVNCGIEILPDLRHMRSLHKLILDENPRVQMKEITIPRHLQMISLRNCELLELPTLRSLTCLKNINVGGNRGIHIDWRLLPPVLDRFCVENCDLTQLYVGDVKIAELVVIGNYLQLFNAKFPPQSLKIDGLVRTEYAVYVQPQFVRMGLRGLAATLQLYDAYQSAENQEMRQERTLIAAKPRRCKSFDGI